jgi:hypothetical protein
MLVVCSGTLPALLVYHYFRGGWRTAIVYVLAFMFGIGFWCIVFLWLLPLLYHDGKIHPRSDDANPPAA